MIYKRLKRTWTFNNCDYDLKLGLVQAFPELKDISSEELCDRFCEMDIQFYEEKPQKVSPLIRLTLPFAFITLILMILFIPIKFMITGTWGYSVGRNKPRLYNWFKSLKLV